MSHGKERKEKNCLNCNARVFGRYCHFCGQENVEPKESLGGLIVHFFNDITHFEGKFLTAIRYLMFKPGFLAAEYARGRRAAYMNPVRMYVFSSAFFFIIFFSIFKINDTEMEIGYSKLQDRFRNTSADFHVGFTTGEIKVNGVKVGNINQISELNEPLIDSLVKAADLEEKKDTTAEENTKSKFTVINFGKNYNSVAEYDSIQNSLPPEAKDGWFKKALNRKSAALNEKYGDRPGLAFARMTDVFLHRLPTLFFISLPIFAFILSLLYIRHRSRFNFVNHSIFSIYYYIFCFLLMLISFASDKLLNITGWSLFSWINVFLFFASFIYLYKAMRNYYRQRRAITVIKFFLLNFIFFFFVLFLFTGFLVFSAFNI